jgi:benzoylformate decarboxylase
VLWGDLVSVARPWTKWAAEVQRVEDVPAAFRRALQMSVTPPTGPVFLALPLDVQMEQAEFDLTPARFPDMMVRPSEQALRRAAEVLLGAANPAILAGSRVQESGAVAELVRVAEALSAPVIQENAAAHGRSSFPSQHPLAGGVLPLFSPEIRERLAGFDVLLAVGTDVVRQYIYHEPARPIPEKTKLVHVDSDPWEIGKNYPVAAAVLGHLKPALAELAELLRKSVPPERGWSAQHAAAREALRREARGQYAARPLTPLAMMDSIARVLPPDAAVVEESPTTTQAYLERAAYLQDPSGYFAHRGWALGWGMNCAIGVKLAWPERPVLAIAGDGSALYGIQGLWTAAHYRIPVTFVIANNSEYRILKDCAGVLGLPGAAGGRFVGMDLVDPEIDFLALARSFGVDSVRVTEPEELSEAVSASLAGTTPRLIEVPVRRLS